MKSILIAVLLLFVAGCNSEPPLSSSVASEEVTAKLSKEIWDKRSAFKGHTMYICEGSLDKPASSLRIRDTALLHAVSINVEGGFRKGYCCCHETQYSIHLCTAEQHYRLYYVVTQEMKDTVFIISNTWNWGYLVSRNEWEHILSKAERVSAKQLKDSCTQEEYR